MRVPATIGHYRVEGEIGKGGFGTVYVASDPKLDRRVAIKVINKEMLVQRPELLSRLWLEARATNRINDPGVVTVTDAGTLEDGTGYMVMEYLEGKTLSQRLLEQKGTLSIDETLDIGIQIASTLVAAHQQRIVHRDLKPANIMLVPDRVAPGGQRVKLLDFGIAKVIRESQSAELTFPGHPDYPHTRINTGMGTPGYMAPEQILDASTATDKCDVYSLGAVLYQVLSGRTPHVAEQQLDLLQKVIQEDPTSLASFVPRVPATLARLIHEMLARPHFKRPDMAQVYARMVQCRSLADSRPSYPPLLPGPKQTGSQSQPKASTPPPLPKLTPPPVIAKPPASTLFPKTPIPDNRQPLVSPSQETVKYHPKTETMDGVPELPPSGSSHPVSGQHVLPPTPALEQQRPATIRKGRLMFSAVLGAGIAAIALFVLIPRTEQPTPPELVPVSQPDDLGTDLTDSGDSEDLADENPPQEPDLGEKPKPPSPPKPPARKPTRPCTFGVLTVRPAIPNENLTLRKQIQEAVFAAARAYQLRLCLGEVVHINKNRSGDFELDHNDTKRVSKHSGPQYGTWNGFLEYVSGSLKRNLPVETISIEAK